MSFLRRQTLLKKGFKYLGKNVKISDRAMFYNAKNISIGDNSRIDDFCVLSAGEGGIEIGRNVHISTYVFIVGRGAIYINDFVGLASRVSIYSSNDDWSGKYMTNPTIDQEFTHVIYGSVNIKKHVLVGVGSIILPNVVLEEGVSIGALSLVKENCKSFYMYGGIPAKIIKKRSKRLLDTEKKFYKKYP